MSSRQTLGNLRLGRSASRSSCAIPMVETQTGETRRTERIEFENKRV